MIKLVIVGVVCFLLALAGTTSVIVMRTPAKVAAADSTAAADSLLRAAGAHAADASHEPAAGHAVAAAGEFDADAPADDFDLMQLAEAIPHEAERVTGAEKRSDHVEPPSDFGRVGKILVNMKPVEAAAILAYLSDSQVEGVLRSLGPRQAATMLAALPTERAAQLSKRLLVVPAGERKP